jgi:MFS family permease
MKHAWLLWLLTSLFFCFEYFLRVSPSVLSSFLEQEMHANLMNISTLSVMFYYPYLFMQIPVGIIVDRFNIKFIMFCAIILFGLATMLFSLMPNIYYGYFYRFIMGFAGAFGFVGTIKIITLYFDSSKSALLSGLTQGLGMLGAVIGLSPMYYCFLYYGWRRTCLVLAFSFLLIGILIFLNKVSNYDHNKHGKSNFWADMKHILNNKFIWFNAIASGCFYGPLLAFGEQWGVSFLSSTHITVMQASIIVSMMFMGMAIGCPVIGFISDTLKNRVSIIRWSCFICMMLLIIVIYHDIFDFKLTYNTILIMMFLYGFFQGAVVVFYALATELVSLKLTGVCMGLTNMASVIIGAIFIQLIAYLLEHLIYHRHVIVSEVSATNFQLVFLLFPLSFLIAIVVSYLIPETYGKRIL